jgi:hypothetical protein
MSKIGRRADCSFRPIIHFVILTSPMLSEAGIDFDWKPDGGGGPASGATKNDMAGI